MGDGPLKPRPPVEEEGDPEQRFPHDGLFRRQGVGHRQQKPPPGRAGESQIVIFHPVHRHEEDGEVQAPVVQPFQHLRLVAAVKGKMDVRMLLPQTGGGAQQADVRVAAHGDLPAQKSGVGPELGLGLVQKSDDVLGPLAQEDAGLGEDDLSLPPEEQGLAQLGFQGHELLGQGGLGDVQALGGPGDVFLPGDGEKIAQYADVHGASPRKQDNLSYHAFCL